MAGTNKPIKRVKATASGVAYTGVATHWNCHFGPVIIIAENKEALATVAQKMEQLKAWQVFERDLCPQVAVFQLSDVEVGHVVP